MKRFLTSIVVAVSLAMNTMATVPPRTVIYDVMLGAAKVAAVTDALYFYRMQEGSIMHARITERTLTLLEPATE